MLLLSWRGEQYYERENMHMERANLSATCIVGFKLLFYLNKYESKKTKLKMLSKFQLLKSILWCQSIANALLWTNFLCPDVDEMRIWHKFLKF